MSEFHAPKPTDQGFPWADVGVAVIGALIAAPLCDAGFHAIVGEHETARGIIAVAIGLPIGILALTFYWWKIHFPSVRAAVLRQTGRWWALILIIAIAYVLGPSIYQRATGEYVSPVGKVAWNFDTAARGSAFFLGMFKTGAQEVRILGFQAHGKNVSKDPVQHFDGWFRSDITNLSKPVYILGQDENDTEVAACVPRIPTAFDQTYGVPGFADFDVVTYPEVGFTSDDGVSTKLFLNTLTPFTVHLEYDGAVIERQFAKEEVRRQIDLFLSVTSLQSVPRILRKKDADKARLRPLQPLTSTPIPTSPKLKLISPKDQFDFDPTSGVMKERSR